MSKLLIAVLLAVFSTSVMAEDLKLRCDLTIQETYSTTEKNIKEEAIAEVTFSPDNKNIFIDIRGAETDIYMSSTKKKRTLSVDNFSDLNKWELRSETRDDKDQNLTYVRSIKIDRNTGFLAYSMTHGPYKLVSSGYCEKINTNVKKF